VNLFYKDVSDLIGTKLVPGEPHNYVVYQNVEYANVRGLETILEFSYALFTGKVSYTLSWSRGTSSYAAENYYRYYFVDPDTTMTPPAVEYYLDFDQRHRIFIQGMLNLPLQTQLYLFGYFGNGFPYTPPGPEGEFDERDINIAILPFQKQIDCVVSKSFTIGNISLNASLEVINILGERYEIVPHYPIKSLDEIHPGDFTTYLSIGNVYYSPRADLDHDGVITPYEAYTSYLSFVKATDDWVNAYTAPRRARFGITFSFH
jgi:hypothetical protein